MIDSSMPWIGGISVRALLSPGSSLSCEAALVGALARGHSLREVSIECGAYFLEPNFEYFHVLLWADREGLHALQNANQPVYIPVPQIEFSEGVRFHDLRFLSPTLRSGFRPHCSSRTRRRRWIDLTICGLLVLARGNSDLVGMATTCDHVKTCFALWGYGGV